MPNDPSRARSCAPLPAACSARPCSPPRWRRRPQAPVPQWPTKPVKLVVTYPPGGTVDAVGRILAPRLAAGSASRW